MSRVRVAGMTVLLLGAVAACGTSSGSDGPTMHSDNSSSQGGRGVGERSGGTSRGPSATKTTAPFTSSSEPVSAPPPYISRVVWVSLPSGRSLQIYPTANGRTVTGDSAEGEAWREVLRKAPGAGTPGMRAQFECHWVFARLAEPNKPSWNLEPWRPVVSAQQMYDTRCNPGGAEV